VNSPPAFLNSSFYTVWADSGRLGWSGDSIL